jgi:hypothetical protein
MQLLDGSLGLAATAAQLAAAANAATAAAAGAPGGASCKVAAVAGSASALAKSQHVSKEAAWKGKAAVCSASAAAAADSSSANAQDMKKAVEVLATVGIGLPYLPLVGELWNAHMLIQRDSTRMIYCALVFGTSCSGTTSVQQQLASSMEHIPACIYQSLAVQHTSIGLTASADVPALQVCLPASMAMMSPSLEGL